MKANTEALLACFAAHSMTDAQGANWVGISKSYLSEMITGKKLPSFAVMQQIYLRTGFEVAPNSFFQGPPSLNAQCK